MKCEVKPQVFYDRLLGMQDDGYGMRAYLSGVTEHHTLSQTELRFGGSEVTTSKLVKFDPISGTIETQNTVYVKRGASSEG